MSTNQPRQVRSKRRNADTAAEKAPESQQGQPQGRSKAGKSGKGGKGAQGPRKNGRSQTDLSGEATDLPAKTSKMQVSSTKPLPTGKGTKEAGQGKNAEPAAPAAPGESDARNARAQGVGVGPDPEPRTARTNCSSASGWATRSAPPGTPGQGVGPNSICQPLANRRLWQQMAYGREELSNGGQPKGAPISTVWESIVGSADRFQHKSPDENGETKKSGYVLPNQTGKECSLTNCEATSECSTVDTTTSWPVFSLEDEIVAERIAAVLMDREVGGGNGSELRIGSRVLSSHFQPKSELRH